MSFTGDQERTYTLGILSGLLFADHPCHCGAVRWTVSSSGDSQAIECAVCGNVLDTGTITDLIVARRQRTSQWESESPATPVGGGAGD